MARQLECGQCKRHAWHERLMPGLGDRNYQPGFLRERRLVWKQRQRVRIRADPEQHEVELGRSGLAQLALVVLRSRVGTELAAHPEYPGRRRIAERLEQRLLRHPIVRAIVVRRDASLIAEPHARLRERELYRERSLD